MHKQPRASTHGKVKFAAIVAAAFAVAPALAPAQGLRPLTAEDAVAAAARSSHEPADVRAAWVRAVAAHQAATYLDEVQETIDVAVEMARGLRATGAWSAIDLMRQEAAQAEFAADAIQVRAAAGLEVDRLGHLLGVAPETLKLPANLAEVPNTRTPVSEIAGGDDWARHIAVATYGAAWERALLYQTKVLPLRRAIAEETALRFNGMLVDVFALLAEVRATSSAVLTSIEATRDFWLAENALRFGGAAHAEADLPPRLVPAGPAMERAH